MFAPGSGLDTIFDFEQGKDLMDVRDYGAQSLADLTIATSGGHSIIDLDGAAVDGAGNEVTVLAIQTRLQQRLHFRLSRTFSLTAAKAVGLGPRGCEVCVHETPGWSADSRASCEKMTSNPCCGRIKVFLHV